MKKNISIILGFAALLATSACNKDFLNQTDPNSQTVGNYFQTENDVLLAVNGVYQALRSNNALGESSGLFSEERSDNTGRNDNQSNAGEPFQFGDFSLLPSNTYLKSHWVDMYQVISRANLVLSNIDNVTFASEDTKKGYAAEAKFVRALIYFHMVRKWGDVPLVTKQMTLDEVRANTFRSKDTAVYSQIVADLLDVVNSSLPNFQTGTNVGRVSKAAGNALLGQVYLTMALTIDNGKRDENLAKAKQYLMACYDMRKFGALKEIPYTDVFSVDKKGTCPELILQIVYKQGDATYASNIAASNQANGETINSQKTASGVGGNVTGDLINEYENNDLRKDFSVHFANASNVKDWYITKYRDVSDAAGKNGYGGNDFILIRYADVILMLAEVNMYLGDNATAIQFLDMVRERAGMPAYATAMQDAAYSAKFPTLKLAILHERRVELAFENHRWFDLLRTFTTQELVDYFHAKDQASFGIAKLSNFSTKDRYYPIPFDEYKLDPVRMYQNTGY
ncbi:RagB/SusD family nutrient uptake outer membrane protein [Chitinophaga filiformis]|uniref:RagB/SusD family nutrient uptake outer membrane protein n=1 Tax=Chitinophaga filiformis TaxID=104663 RepID=UPI001F2C1C3E|nr:RagB/SusD family nutrient uptake outer membrane protein [Chitinophaga filiformis]MCF6407619.1 RagB/SusD family nutrient uptake outer membrane protein [Chitinophaga filiformis]MCF6407676.1 RagB/SusD family nutrient uptake outer membrane protein [Chitinophaga filiformis]